MKVSTVFQTTPTYLPWLYDNREAWEKALADPRYRYDLTLDQFMAIYEDYRSGSKSVSKEEAEAIAAAAFTAVSTPQAISAPQEAAAPAMDLGDLGGAGAEAEDGASILSQDDIDSLLSGLD